MTYFKKTNELAKQLFIKHDLDNDERIKIRQLFQAFHQETLALNNSLDLHHEHPQSERAHVISDFKKQLDLVFYNYLRKCSNYELISLAREIIFLKRVLTTIAALKVLDETRPFQPKLLGMANDSLEKIFPQNNNWLKLHGESNKDIFNRELCKAINDFNTSMGYGLEPAERWGSKYQETLADVMNAL